jgi:hypothetical protein
MLLGGLVHLLVLVALLDYFGCRPESFVVKLFVGTAALGSTLLFILSRSYTYHEAIIWASALALASIYGTLRYADLPSAKWLSLAIVCAAGSFFSRATAGAGAFASLIVLAVLPQDGVPARRLRLRLAVAVSVAACAVIYVSLNYVRFGTLVDAAPYKYYGQANPERLARVGGSLIHPEILPFQVSRILNAGGLKLRDSFPWIQLDPGPSLSRRPAHYDHMEPQAGLPAVEPGFVLLSVTGLIWGARRDKYPWRLRLMIGGLLAPLVVLGMSAVMSHRYMQDGYPFLATGAALGMGWVASLPPSPRKTAFAWVLACLFIWSLVVNPPTTLVAQREWSFGQDEQALRQYRVFRARIDSLVGGKPLTVLKSRWGAPAPVAVPGQLLELSTGDGRAVSRYWFDGRAWQFVGGPNPGKFVLIVNTAGLGNGKWSLLTVGHEGALDAFTLFCDNGQFQVGMDHWGIGYAYGPLFRPPSTGNHSVEVELDQLNDVARVTWDGQSVFERRVRLYAFNPNEILLGRSPLPQVHGADFVHPPIRVSGPPACTKGAAEDGML